MAGTTSAPAKREGSQYSELLGCRSLGQVVGKQEVVKSSYQARLNALPAFVSDCFPHLARSKPCEHLLRAASRQTHAVPAVPAAAMLVKIYRERNQPLDPISLLPSGSSRHWKRLILLVRLRLGYKPATRDHIFLDAALGKKHTASSNRSGWTNSMLRKERRC